MLILNSNLVLLLLHLSDLPRNCVKQTYQLDDSHHPKFINLYTQNALLIKNSLEQNIKTIMCQIKFLLLAMSCRLSAIKEARENLLNQFLLTTKIFVLVRSFNKKFSKIKVSVFQSKALDSNDSNAV